MNCTPKDGQDSHALLSRCCNCVPVGGKFQKEGVQGLLKKQKSAQFIMRVKTGTGTGGLVWNYAAGAFVRTTRRYKS